MTHNITLSFSIEEMKEYLKTLDYEIKIVKVYYLHGGNGGGNTHRAEKMIEIARRLETTPTEVLHESKLYHLTIPYVFTKELKAKLLTL